MMGRGYSDCQLRKCGEALEKGDKFPAGGNVGIECHEDLTAAGSLPGNFQDAPVLRAKKRDVKGSQRKRERER